MTPTKPDARNYSIPKAFIIPNGSNNEGLAFHPDPDCLALSTQVMMYNQELLFLQGKDILQRLDRLDASIAATAAGHVGPAPALGSRPIAAGPPILEPRTFKEPTSRAAVRTGQTPVVESKPVAVPPTVRAGPVPFVGPKPIAAPPTVGVGPAPIVGLQPASAPSAVRVRPAPVVGSVPAVAVAAAASGVEAKAKQPVAKATGARLPSLRGLLEKNTKFVGAMAAGSKDNPSGPRSSKTEGREQAITRNEEISQLRKEVTTLNERLTRLYEEQRQKSLLEIRDSGVTGERSHEPADPKAHTALVGKNGDNDSTSSTRIRETTSNKRAGSPILTTNSEVEAGRSPRASKQFEDSHRDKKVKVEVKVKSE